MIGIRFIVPLIAFMGLIISPASAWTGINQTNASNYSLGVTLNGSYISSFTVNITSATTKTGPYEISTDNLVGWWKLDENTGTTAVDSSGNGNTGTWSGHTTANWTTGKYNTGVRFDNINDYINAGTGATLDGMTDLTIGAWVYWNGGADSNYDHIVSKHDGGGAGIDAYFLAIQNTNIINFRVVNTAGATVVAASSTTPQINTWNYIIATYDADGPVKVYLNGIDVSADAYSGIGAVRSGAQALSIGRYGTGDYGYFNGTIDDVKIYGRVLSADEIKDQYYARVEQLRIRTNANTTWSGAWNTSTDNPININYTGGELINTLIFNITQNLTQSGVLIYDYNRTAVFKPNIIINSSLQLLTPANASTVAADATLQWHESPSNPVYSYQISTDHQFINIIESGTGATDANGTTSATVTLSEGTVYYWKAKNATGSYVDWWTFTTSVAPEIPGWLDVKVWDERNNTAVTTFDVQLYNSTTVLTKAAAAGWANFTSAEVAGGEYLVRVVPNASYASRSILVTSPTNVTVYVPSTTYTIDTIAFYLLDYTNYFPWANSYMVISKNSTTVHSAYFDADAKVATYLIRGDSYTITVYNPENSKLQQWGNYISTGSGNVEVVLMDLGVNTTKYAPFVYNITWSSSNITLRWTDAGGVLTSLNYSIYKSNSRALVHQLITSVPYGQSEYIITNTSDIYFVYFTANTTQGTKQFSQVIEYRAGDARPDEGATYGTWSYNTANIPAWIKSAFALIALMLLAGSFGSLHRGEGGIITGIMSVLFWYWDILDVSGALAGFMGGMLLFAVLYHLESKRRTGGFV